MKRLTNRERWDATYQKALERAEVRAPKMKASSEKLRKHCRRYSDYFLWDVIFKKYMPNTKGSKVLEVGSAPGHMLVRLHETFGFVPYGVEYSEPGVTQNRKLFGLHGIDPANVIHADFFEDNFQQKFRGYFDIVVSVGFIEHFTAVEDVIAKHLNVLDEGGHLIVNIPNLNRRSLYGAWASLFNKERLRIHNIDIMSKEAFTKLFNNKGLSTLFCDYYGTLGLHLMTYGNTPLTRWGRRACRISDPILRLIFGDKGFESQYFSPFLLYIGVKDRRRRGLQAAT
ncbi:MAG: class I SAM-dependent methyltransferase [Planctomycetota bacterium]|jgi:SAM-dependent methyltransferase